jgi:hypothetical protein
MALLDLLKKPSQLSLEGQTPRIENQQQSKLEKQFREQSRLDLTVENPPKYSDNKPQ